MTDKHITITDHHAGLAIECLVEIEGIAEILRGLVAAHLDDGGVRAASLSMLRRVEDLTDLACACWSEDPIKHFGKGTADLEREIWGTPPKSLNAAMATIG